MNFCGLLTPRINPSTLLLRGLHGVLLSITYRDNGIVGYMRTSLFLLMLFFTSYVMMLDLEYLVFRRLLIILLTERCVRDGPSLLISLVIVVLCERWSFPLNILGTGGSTPWLVIGGPYAWLGP